MGRVSARTEVAGPLEEVERRWYDVARWPQFVDGCARVLRVDGPWPAEPAEVAWRSHPGGRGEVVEVVTDHEPGASQELAVRDASIEGTQTVYFAQLLDDRVAVTLELDYRLGGSAVGRFLLDIFVRWTLRQSLERTLAAFAALSEGS
jgi:uncharacterized membrane protein